MDLKARVDVNCERKEADGQTENRAPMSHSAKAGAKINVDQGR